MLDLVPSREDFAGKSIICHCQLYFLLLFLLENFDMASGPLKFTVARQIPLIY